MRYENKVAIVLGVSHADSMGGRIAQRLAKEGAKVIVAARQLDKAKSVADLFGGDAVRCDITSEADLSALAQYAVDHYGHLDVAVNCVGEAIMGYIAATDEATLRRATDLHFVGPFLFIKQMTARMGKGSAIVTISSITATLTFPNHAAYMGAKAGTDHIVRVAAFEYGPKGIRINSVSPGFTESPMTKAFLEMPGVREAFEQEIPLGRLNTVDDIAAATLWLCSDESYVTGQNMQVNGGNTLNRLPRLELN